MISKNSQGLAMHTEVEAYWSELMISHALTIVVFADVSGFE